MVRRLLIGPEGEGTFTLFGVLFFFIGIQIFALGSSASTSAGYTRK
jgi:undecaprenyl-phosphate 4-deoxy-4-formamido-L-arabinose transferase